MITQESIPLRASQTTIRQDPNGVLLFQMATDQMYLAGPAAGAVFDLCDGTRSVRAIVAVLLEHNPAWNRAEAVGQVASLLDALRCRGLIELWS